MLNVRTFSLTPCLIWISRSSYQYLSNLASPGKSAMISSSDQGSTHPVFWPTVRITHSGPSLSRLLSVFSFQWFLFFVVVVTNANYSDWPVFGISVDLGTITSTSSPIVWGLGLIRDPCIQYETASGNIEQRSSYFWSNFSTDVEVVSFPVNQVFNDMAYPLSTTFCLIRFIRCFSDMYCTKVEAFLNDFDRALSAAVDFDTQLMANASQISPEYADLLVLSARQTLASLDITISKDSNGNWNTSDVMIFMDDFDPVGSSGGWVNNNKNGLCHLLTYPPIDSSVNPVDVMFSAFPAFITLNPDLGKYLLAPLLELQEDPLYSGSFAIHDLGTWDRTTGSIARLQISNIFLICRIELSECDGSGY